MKKVLLLVALSLGLMVSAQEKLAEGILVSKMTMSSDDEQMNSQLALIGDMEATTYFKGEKSRNETINPMSGEIITIIDNEVKQILILMNNPMVGKMYSKTDVPEEDKSEGGVTVKKGTETKKVLGYDCKQYFVSVKQNGQEMEMEVFTTNAISAYSQQTASFSSKVDGFPLYFVMTMNQGPAKMKITSEVTDIKKETVSDEKFNMTPPKGYEEIKQ